VALVFGEQESICLVAKVDKLLDELFAVNVDWNQHTLVSGTEFAVAEFREKHPEVNELGAVALGWAYSFLNK
jgi:hypothetical protein